MPECIEREAVNKLLHKEIEHTWHRVWGSVIWELSHKISQIPAADVVEVKHGEWLDAQYTYFGAKRYECSQCRDDEFWKKRYIEIKENYCPNCGAKMDGERRTDNGNKK